MGQWETLRETQELCIMVFPCIMLYVIPGIIVNIIECVYTVIAGVYRLIAHACYW